MAKKIRALHSSKIIHPPLSVCRCPEAEDGEHECPALEAQWKRNRHIYDSMFQSDQHVSARSVGYTYNIVL
jgi:hypothetical protein